MIRFCPLLLWPVLAYLSLHYLPISWGGAAAFVACVVAFFIHLIVVLD